MVNKEWWETYEPIHSKQDESFSGTWLILYSDETYKEVFGTYEYTNNFARKFADIHGEWRLAPWR